MLVVCKTLIASGHEVGKQSQVARSDLTLVSCLCRSLLFAQPPCGMLGLM
jgi:hypothetical protein